MSWHFGRRRQRGHGGNWAKELSFQGRVRLWAFCLQEWPKSRLTELKQAVKAAALLVDSLTEGLHWGHLSKRGRARHSKEWNLLRYRSRVTEWQSACSALHLQMHKSALDPAHTLCLHTHIRTLSQAQSGSCCRESMRDRMTHQGDTRQQLDWHASTYLTCTQRWPPTLSPVHTVCLGVILMPLSLIQPHICDLRLQ